MTDPAGTPAQDARAFAGERILDFTQVLAGPFCAQLAMQAVDMIKLEARGGEPMRSTPTSREWSERAMGSAWMAVNTNKRSLRLDLARAEAVEIVHRLAGEADAVCEKFRPSPPIPAAVGSPACRCSSR
jgi:crotonobetainyl-CoA:carnitine CoA-transferase CaiB-like acyl-CoA transferase